MAIYTAISLCSGIGMLDHGINAALDGAFMPILYVEREAFCAANLAEQMEKKFLAPAHIWDNVKTVMRPRVSRVIRERLGGKRLDFIVGGIPCQVYSQAGKRLGRNDDRDLWPATLEAIAVYQPRFVFIENVEGISSHIDGARRLVCDLEGAGYRTKAGLFSSKECGAFHERRRWFFLGIAESDEQRRIRRRTDGFEKPAGRSSGNVGIADENECKWQSISNQSSHGRSDIDIDRASRKLADAAGIRYEHNKSFERIIRTGKANRWLQQLAGNSSGLADTERKKQQRRRESKNVDGAPQEIQGGKDERQWNGRTAGDSNIDFPHYAPARNDFRSWAIVAEVDPSRMPAIESALRRVVDGLANWNLQLSAIGNGVDPLVAAYAFLTLAACMQED